MTARYLAVKALVRQEQDGYANLVLDAELKRCNPPLPPRDAAFAAAIFYTVLERRNRLDYQLNKFSKKPLAKLDAPVRAILRAGLAQAQGMDVPLPAAVNESVKLARAFGKTSAAGMINAVLRRASAATPAPEDFADPLDRLCIYYSLSRPIATLLYAQYGETALAMAEAFICRQPTYIRVNTLKTNDAELTEKLQAEGCTVAPGPWQHALRVEFPTSPAATAAFGAGLFHVQGLPSQYAALCLAAQPGQRVLDLCAAPGGKSLTLAQAMQNSGALDSGEGIASRVSLLQKAFARCGVTCATARHSNAAVFDAARGHYDRVLCDVPCTGLGVIAKKPDIRYKPLDDVQSVYTLQQRILQNGAKYLAQNGRLVYSTCTVNVQENQAQIAAFLQKNTNFRVAMPEIEFPGVEQTEYGTLFLPHSTGTDGFFVTILENF